MVLLLPKRAKFITSIFKGDDISEFSSEKQHLWVEILNKSYEAELKIDRHSPVGFLVFGPEHLKLKHAKQNITTTKKQENELPVIEPILVQAKNKKHNFAVL